MMFTCGECVDVECVGHENPEQPACDEFTTEMWTEEADIMDTVDTGWDEDRFVSLEESVMKLTELVYNIESIFVAMNSAYMGDKR